MRKCLSNSSGALARGHGDDHRQRLLIVVFKFQLAQGLAWEIDVKYQTNIGAELREIGEIFNLQIRVFNANLPGEAG